jgi:fucose permease
MDMVKTYSKLWVAYLFFFMTILGITENIRSVCINLFKQDLQLNDQSLSGLMMVGTFGSVVFQFIGGFLIDRIGYRKIYHLSCIACALPLLLIHQLNGYAHFLIFFFILHSGFTLFSLATNATVPRMGDHASILLNITHGCYGLGAMFSPLLTDFFLARQRPWQEIYWYLSFVYLLLWFLLFLVGNRGIQYFSRDLQSDSENPKATQNPKASLWQFLTDPFVWLFGLLFGSAIASEVATSSWLMNYLSKENIDQKTGSQYLLLFFGLFTFGRLIGGFWVKKIGEIKAVFFAMILSMSFLILGIQAKSEYKYLIAVSGLFFSVIFPTLVMVLNQFFHQHKAHILGIVASTALMIYLCFNGVIGYVNDHFSHTIAFYLLPCSMMIALCCFLVVVYHLKQQSASNQHQTKI